jgi:hypothetical protein
MDNQQNPGNDKTKPVVLQPTEVSRNENPRANENIRVRTDEPQTENTETSGGVGSEITDGEDA